MSISYHVNRRRYLGALGLAGGLAYLGVSRIDETQRRVSLAEQDSIAADHGIRIDADVLLPTITDVRTALVRITTTNEGQKRALSVGTGNCGLFARGDGGSAEPPGLWLHSPNYAVNIPRDGDRWTRDPSAGPRLFTAEGCHTTEYDDGESLSNWYVVWDDYHVDGYLEPGTYRWENDVSVWNDPAGATSDPPDATARWGFSLTVERPD